MRRTIWIAISLSLVATAGFLIWMKPSDCAALWIGAVWGLLNFWCMAQVAKNLLAGKRGWRLLAWFSLKGIVLYGGLVWLLVGLRIWPLGWLAGFTLSLIAVAAAAFPSFRPLFLCTRTRQMLTAGVLFGFSNLALASEAAHEGGQAAHPPEIPNFITLITHWAGHGPVVQFLHTWENAIFAFLIVGIVGGAIAFGARALALMPTRGQVAVEAVVEGLDNLVCGVLGKIEGRRYLPFLGTLFLFILSMNLAGLVPGLKSPTSRFEMTGALGLCVFVFVQWTGIRRMGLGGYLDHMIGEPRDAVGWILSPLMLFIHGIGELVKPLSLSLRLFGNIMGEDTLLGVFVLLGALTMAWSHLPIGIPLHLPFVLLAIIFSVVQALVFTSLSMIYIYMMLPHHEAHSTKGE